MNISVHHHHLYRLSIIKKQFFLMQQQIMAQLTSRQSQVIASVRTANIDNDQTDETIEIQPNEAASTMKIEKHPTNDQDKLFVHYTHEKRFQSFKRDAHKGYDQIFKHTNAMDLRLIVGNRNRRDAKNELIRKRPKSAILQNKAKQIKNKYMKLLGKLCLHSTYMFFYFFSIH